MSDAFLHQGDSDRDRDLLSHAWFLFENFSGKWFRKTTVSDKANYVVGKGGSIRHANAQFKGSKKDRKRFKAACLAAINAPVPDGFEEIQPDVILQDKPTLDIVYDVALGEWTTTPYYKCALTQLQQRFGTFLRAARVK